MVNINKLKGKIVENGLSIGKIADSIGINTATLYRKLAKNGGDLKAQEIDQMIQLLKLDPNEVISIFFAQIVA